MVDFLRAKSKANGQRQDYVQPPVQYPDAPTEEASIEWISPAIAAELLETNTHNRSVADRHVAKLRRDMEENRWYVTSQGIGIDTNGDLCDGQHRLWAILQSGKTIRTLVVRGIDPAAMMAIDETRKRSFGDDLKREQQSEYSSKAAMVRMVAKAEASWSRGLAFRTARMLQLSRYELHRVMDDMEQRGDLTAAIRAGARIRHKTGCPTTAIAAAHFLGQVVYGKPFTDDFFHRVHGGVGLQIGDPEKALLDRFSKETMLKPKAESEIFLAWILRAMIGAYRGESLKRIEFKGRIPKELPKL